MDNQINRKNVRLKVGDILEIPLSDGTYAYGQYYYLDPRNGQTACIYDVRSKERLPVSGVVQHEFLFGPVFVGIRGAVNGGVWNVIGHDPTHLVQAPQFLYTSPISKKLKWYLVEGDRLTELGPVVPEKYKKLERTGSWSAYDVNKRIQNGGKFPPEWQWLEDEKDGIQREIKGGSPE